MVEEIHTGGLKRFVSGKVERDFQLESRIEKAYEKVEIRKRKERRIKIFIIISILLILFLVIWKIL